MAKIIDILGGIRLSELSEAEARKIRESGSKIQAGTDVLLTGNEAVSFARIRKIDSDFNRTDRQREVLQQIILKLFGMKFSEIMPLLDQILPNLETNLTKNEIISIGWQVLSLDYGTELEQLRIPVDGSYEFANIHGASVILPNINKNTDALKTFLYGS